MKLNILTTAFVLISLCLATPLSAQTKEPLPSSNQNALSTSQTKKAAPESDWYRYTATDGSYSALFPGQPENSVEPDESVQVMYEDQANNRAYLTQNSFLSVNPSQLDVEEVLDAVITSVSEDGATVTKQTKISLNGLPGREVTVQNKEGVVTKMRAFVNPKMPALYLAIVSAENGDKDFPEAQAFLDSLSIPQK